MARSGATTIKHLRRHGPWLELLQLRLHSAALAALAAVCPLQVANLGRPQPVPELGPWYSSC